MPCCDCSTKEEESELSTDQGTEQLPTIYPYNGPANILLLYTGATMRDLTVEQHSRWNRLVLNCPYRANTVTTPVIHQRDAQHALLCLCLVSEIFHDPKCQPAATLGCIPCLK